MKIKHKNITNETDLTSMEFSNKFKKQYPVDLGFVYPDNKDEIETY